MYFGDRKKNVVILPHSAQRKHAFWGETKEISKSNRIAPRIITAQIGTQIGTQIYHIIDAWRYCKCLEGY